MTHTKHTSVMAARNTAYARNVHVTTSAGISTSQKRMKGQV